MSRPRSLRRWSFVWVIGLKSHRRMVHVAPVLQEHKDRDVAYHDLGRAGLAGSALASALTSAGTPARAIHQSTLEVQSMDDLNVTNRRSMLKGLGALSARALAITVATRAAAAQPEVSPELESLLLAYN